MNALQPNNEVSDILVARDYNPLNEYEKAIVRDGIRTLNPRASIAHHWLCPYHPEIVRVLSLSHGELLRLIERDITNSTTRFFSFFIWSYMIKPLFLSHILRRQSRMIFLRIWWSIRSWDAHFRARACWESLSRSKTRSYFEKNSVISTVIMPVVQRPSIMPKSERKARMSRDISQNEWLLHTGAHKMNHCLGHALIAHRMWKNASSQKLEQDNMVSRQRRWQPRWDLSAPSTWGNWLQSTETKCSLDGNA